MVDQQRCFPLQPSDNVLLKDADRKELFTLSKREDQRVPVLDQGRKGALTLKTAAPMMKDRYRQAKRLLSRYRRDGLRGLAHQRRGRPGLHAVEKGGMVAV